MKTLASTRTGHCPAGIFKNKISNVTKNEEAGAGPVPCPASRTYYHQANSANTRLTLLVLTIKVSCKAEDR